MRLRIGLFCSLLAAGGSAAANDFPALSDPDRLASKRVDIAPRIDGVINPQEWAGAVQSSRSLVSISTTQLTGDKGTYWIGYDDKFIYVAARIHLVDPSRINAGEFRQNVSLQGNDAVTFLLDVKGSSSEFNSFTFNASGATNMRLAGGRAAKQEWLGQFDAAGQITETGWEGEAKIAWDLMPLPAAGANDIKFLFDWYASYNQQGLSFHSTQGDLTKMHTLTGVEIPKVKRSREVQILPYFYGGVEDDGSSFSDAGVDLKTSIGKGLTAVGTINPDFRNIENDILDLDFSNFERLADESRPFFLEGAQFRRTGSVNNRVLFAPQRINSFDAGLNIYGSLNPQTQIGVLSTYTDQGDKTLVGTVGFSPEPNTSIRGAFVALDRPGEDNISGGVDVLSRQEDFLLFGSFQQTDDDVTGVGRALSYGTQYRDGGLTGTVIVDEISSDFNPRVGFAPQTGYQGVTGSFEYEQSYVDGPINQSRMNIVTMQQDKYDGGHYRELNMAGGSISLKNGLGIQVSAMSDHFMTMNNRFYTLGITKPRNDPYRGWSLSRTEGKVAGKDYSSTSAAIRYRPVKRLQLGLRHQFVEHFSETDQTVLTFNWELDKYRSFGGRVVGEDDKWNWFASYSMRGNLGAEYFLIIGDPNAESFQKTVILKAVVPVSF